jgi:hypothetical protein
MRIGLLLLTVIVTTICCSNPQREERARLAQKKYNDSVTLAETPPSYRSINFVDSFYSLKKDSISKNNVLKEHLEKVITLATLPLVEKKGFYDDLPFVFVTSETSNGKIYGNFVFNENNHFVKVQCIISQDQIKQLTEGKKYFIKFKLLQFSDGVTLDYNNIQLPTAQGYLVSFKAV